MLVGVVTGPSFQDVKRQVKKALDIFEMYPISSGMHNGMLEFRFDLFDTLDLDLFKTFTNSLYSPLIFTCRTKKGLLENDRILFLKKLLEFKPDYIDLEEHLSKELFSYFSLETKVICSYHNFDNTSDLENVFTRIKQKKADIYKICTFANSSLDALAMLTFVSSKDNVAGMCMGEKGQITRILGPVIGSRLTYAFIEKPAAPGQLSLKELYTIYNIPTLTKNTKVYALLGDLVDKSIGHIFHNQIFSLKEARDSVYVKIPLKKEELSSFFTAIKDLPFFGFSVTMPLKEAVLEYLDGLGPDARRMRAVNTIVRDNGWQGMNTDGIGAFLSIEKHISTRDKIVVVIGAGGAAKAIIQKLVENRAKVVIANRTKEKALMLAKEYDAEGVSLEALEGIFKRDVDLIINTVPDASLFFLKLCRCNNKPIVMDMVYNPVWTDFLKKAKESGCRCIFGYEMFIHQAVIQQQIFSKQLAVSI